MHFKVAVKQGVQILLVDDEPTVRRSMKMLLEHDGHKVFAVESGEAALAHLAQRKFDLVITDFSMPGMPGDQLVARIRERQPDQPIIMAAAFVPEYKVFGQASEKVDALLVKPFSFSELREAIEQVLAQALPDQTTHQTNALPPGLNPSTMPGFVSPPNP